MKEETRCQIMKTAFKFHSGIIREPMEGSKNGTAVIFFVLFAWQLRGE